MSAACISMVLVFFATSFLFFRSGRRDYGLAILPLISVPLGHSIATFVVPYLVSHFSFFADKYVLIFIGIDMSALILGCIALGITSQNIESNKNRRLFITLSIVYLIIIAWVVLSNVLSSGM